MSFSNVLELAVFLGVFGLLSLFVLWPDERKARRVLRRWGIDQPSEEDVVEAVRYLKRRAVCYPWLFFLVPLLARAFGLTSVERSVGWTVAWTLLLGGLLGELFALRRAPARQRQAMLARRRVIDLVPVWGLVVLTLAISVGIVRMAIAPEWGELGIVVVCAVVVIVVIALAVIRPAAGDPVVDQALRVRSARVAAGLAIAVPAALPQAEMNLPKALLMVVSLIALLSLARPARQVAAPAG
ncbi:MAG TPA: hypothetical protein VHX59_08475 [Mycobacteriales bacterium]|nr:hypothetical protein [Mycobacteriales bacterium]